MIKSNKFSPEVRERAVRMVQEHRGDYPSLWAAIESIAPKIGCVPQTLNEWVKQRPKSTAAIEQARPPRMPSASRSWSARSRNCAGPTTY